MGVRQESDSDSQFGEGMLLSSVKGLKKIKLLGEGAQGRVRLYQRQQLGSGGHNVAAREEDLMSPGGVQFVCQEADITAVKPRMKISTGDDQSVAIKFFTQNNVRRSSFSRRTSTPTPLSEMEGDSFERERFALQALHNHPNVVTMHFAGDHIDRDGRPLKYIAMEALGGGSLKTQINLGSKGLGYNLGNIVQWANEMASALACAHSKDIIHCDLKTDNIVLDESWELRIIDWASSTPVATGRAVGCGRGTDRYMPPEYLLADTLEEQLQHTQPAWDVYSFGIILFELMDRAHLHDKIALMESGLSDDSQDGVFPGGSSGNGKRNETPRITFDQRAQELAQLFDEINNIGDSDSPHGMACNRTIDNLKLDRLDSEDACSLIEASGSQGVGVSVRLQTGWRPPMGESWPPAICDIIRKCWAPDPKNRPSFEEVLEDLAQISVPEGITPAHSSDDSLEDGQRIGDTGDHRKQRRTDDSCGEI
mmetsp:Transcript_13319/g.42238  ORF Transcript_13319/g.42238 Transcript_13319/m.42238 type:complete len:480 (-) Transcript_13319:119-1558(-)